MPLSPPTPAPDNAIPPPGMCILHADFHPVRGECWVACLDWDLEHPHLSDDERRHLYQADVERAILDALIRTLRPSQP
jgi:hypothetical protein